MGRGPDRGRIVDLLTEADIPDLTELILVNAVTFDGSWMNQSDPTDTRPAVVHARRLVPSSRPR